MILDSWFFFQASAPFGDGLARIQGLLDHPKFDLTVPNSIRSVLGGLAVNPTVFHSSDGSGYIFMAEKVCDLDKINPITASRLVKVFSKWKSYSSTRGSQILHALDSLSKAELSPNTREVVDLIRGT